MDLREPIEIRLGNDLDNDSKSLGIVLKVRRLVWFSLQCLSSLSFMAVCSGGIYYVNGRCSCRKCDMTECYPVKLS